MLAPVTWPDEQGPCVIAGWLFDEDVQAAQISERAGTLPEPPDIPRGTKRWIEWMLGRLAATEAASRAGAVNPSITVSKSGAPRVDGSDLRVSIAHTTGLAIAAAAPVPVGIDVERADRDVSRLVRVLGPGECDLAVSIGVVGALVAKEAVAKATGFGLGGSLSRWPLLDAELSGSYPIVNVATPDERVVSVQLFTWQEFVVGVAAIPPA